MSAASMWTAMQAAIAAVTPYQGSDPVASAAYRAAVGQAMCTAIISEQNSPVAWDGTNDRILDVGQFTQDSFTAQTSMPLHIACGDGQIYEMRIVGSYTAAPAATNPYLQPNNSVPATNSYQMSFSGTYGAGTADNSYIAAAADGGFRLNQVAPINNLTATIWTSTLYKSLQSRARGYETTDGNRWYTVDSIWNDTTTVWSSLGTVIQPNAWTGQIVCRRIA